MIVFQPNIRRDLVKLGLKSYVDCVKNMCVINNKSDFIAIKCLQIFAGVKSSFKLLIFKIIPGFSRVNKFFLIMNVGYYYNRICGHRSVYKA